MGKIDFSQLRELANENIEDVFRRLGIQDFHIGISNIRAKCPIHDGDNDTAFSYDIDKMCWRCFTRGCHQDGSSIIGLVFKILQKDNPSATYTDAIKWLTQTLEITDEIETKSDGIYEILNQLKNRKLNHNPCKINPYTVDSLKNRLRPSRYFAERGFDEETISTFMISDCVDKTKPMAYRAFAPVVSPDGKMVYGFSGRTMLPQCKSCGLFHNTRKACPSDDSKTRAYAKWFHWGFNSGHVVYNLNVAQKYIKETGTAIVGEGIKDVWWLHQNNIRNSVSIFGLHLTRQHVSLLTQYGVINLILALDHDNAGVEAMETIKRSYNHIFNIYSLVDFIPEGKDIADLDGSDIQECIVPFVKGITHG